MLPDGVLPPFLRIGGWVAAISALAMAFWHARGPNSPRLIPLAGTVAAIVTNIMSPEIQRIRPEEWTCL